MRLRGPLKVGRNAGTGIQSPNYLVTCNTCGTDSILVDAFTLDPAAPGTAPSVGTRVSGGCDICSSGRTVDGHTIDKGNHQARRWRDRC